MKSKQTKAKIRTFKITDLFIDFFRIVPMSPFCNSKPSIKLCAMLFAIHQNY